MLPDCYQRDRAERLCFCVVGVKILAEEGGVRFYCQNTANVNHFFTLLGKMFFTPYGKEFFTYLGKQIFIS